MTRNLKALGLAFAAIFTMSAVAASGAQASGAHFRINNGTAGNYILIASADINEPDQTLVTDIGAIECDIVSAKSTVTSSTTTEATFEDIEYKADYFEPSTACEAFGFEANLNFEGCHYTFTAGTWNGAANDSTGTVHLTCPTGQSVKLEAPGCTLTVPGGQTLGGITYTNQAGTPDDITVDANVAGISYSWSGAKCGSGSDTNGTYVGKATVRAYEDKSGVEGNQVSLTVVDGGT